MTSPSSPTPRRQIQRELIWLIVLILVVDAVAIGAYHLFDMDLRRGTPRLAFTVAWLVATLVVVIPRLQRIRRHRGHGRHQRGH